MKTGSIACRSAPAENGPPSSDCGDQITRPWKRSSASSIAFARPAITPGPSTFILVFGEATSTPSRPSDSRLQRRIDSSSNAVTPAVAGAELACVDSPESVARKTWRR
jgi:hypothetical protein